MKHIASATDHFYYRSMDSIYRALSTFIDLQILHLKSTPKQRNVSSVAKYNNIILTPMMRRRKREWRRLIFDFNPERSSLTVGTTLSIHTVGCSWGHKRYSKCRWVCTAFRSVYHTLKIYFLSWKRVFPVFLKKESGILSLSGKFQQWI